MEALEKLLAEGVGLKIKLIEHKQIHLMPSSFENAGVSASYHDLFSLFMATMQREAKLAAICRELKEALETAKGAFDMFVYRYPCPDTSHELYRLKTCTISEEAIEDIQQVLALAEEIARGN